MNAPAGSGPTFDLDAADEMRSAIGMLVRAVREISVERPEGQLETLGLLTREGPQSIADLARRRRIRHQSMSATVAELEAQGLVERSPDPSDARGVLISLTSEGSGAIASSRTERATAILRAVETTLDDEERRRLHGVPELLMKLAAGLGDR